MTNRKRNALKAWIWATWLPGLLLAGGLVLAGCSKDPVEPAPVKPEPTFSVTFADGDFKAAFQISSGGGYVAAGTGTDGQGFIYKIEPNGTESTHYVFDQNASGERVVDVLPVDDKSRAAVEALQAAKGAEAAGLQALGKIVQALK